MFSKLKNRLWYSILFFWNRKNRSNSDSEEEESSENESENSGSEEESESDEEDNHKAKGVQGLIEIENPNRVVRKAAEKVSKIDLNAGPSKQELSRREREELERQRNQAHYQKMHAEGTLKIDKCHWWATTKLMVAF